MSIMITEIYEALVEAGTSRAKSEGRGRRRACY